MRFIRCFRNDVRQGILREWYYFMPILVLAVIFCIDFYRRTNSICNYLGYQGNRCFLDYVIFIFGGMQEYFPSPDNSFLFPAIWIVTTGYASFLTLRYPYDDLEGYGQQIILKAGKRSRWWMSKCLWMCAKTLFYYILIYLVILLCCKVMGGTAAGYPDPFFIEKIFYIKAGSMPREFQDILLLLFLPFLMSLTINMVQLVLGLLCGVAFSFLVSLILLVGSAYYLNPVMLGNGGMLIRSSLINVAGLDPRLVILIYICIWVVALIFGMYWFQRKDILRKED